MVRRWYGSDKGHLQLKELLIKTVNKNQDDTIKTVNKNQDDTRG